MNNVFESCIKLAILSSLNWSFSLYLSVFWIKESLVINPYNLYLPQIFGRWHSIATRSHLIKLCKLEYLIKMSHILEKAIRLRVSKICQIYMHFQVANLSKTTKVIEEAAKGRMELGEVSCRNKWVKGPISPFVEPIEDTAQGKSALCGVKTSILEYISTLFWPRFPSPFAKKLIWSVEGWRKALS